MIAIDFDILYFMEDKTYIAYCPELDISSCGNTKEKARSMIHSAVKLFLDEAEKMGTLETILEEANYKKDPQGKWLPPKLISTELASL